MKPTSILFIVGCLAAVLGVSAAAMAQKSNTLTPKEKREGWQLLFDGTSTQGWSTPKGAAVPSGWAVKDGTLMALKGGKGGDIVSLNQYGDFDLMFDYNIEAEGNSGVKYFYTTYQTGGNLGIEYQLLDDQLAEDNKKENHLTGSFYDVMPPNPSLKKLKAPGQWNNVRIVAKGKQVEHWLNGVKILEFTRGTPEYTQAVSYSKFKDAVPAFGTVEKGHILLQEHGAEVAFRNIKIKPL
jgi:hypothetical protein